MATTTRHRPLFVAFTALLLLAASPVGNGAAKPPSPGRRELNGILAAIGKAQKYTTWAFQFKRTGLDPVIAKYADRQPLTFLLPRDDAFKLIPPKIKNQLSGQKLVKLMQYHMLMEKWSIEFMYNVRVKGSTRMFRTVQGSYMYCLANPVPSSTVVKYSNGQGVVASVIPPGNIGGKNVFPRFLAHGLTTVLIPPGVFT
eukprot:TRINITY_DN54498_c0_g1_i1.p2 TRINITY_DN54498_c0_g1~~TRINITY_DN54498_c0_g1_i1.p2  ORF type:complete len:199 (-),score=5.29 TRINITY_DN54498_c0_g1_i1:211-807(-)